MSQLPYLMTEICTGIEIYYTGRFGGQYLKTSFVLCDDYTELTSKLFLTERDSSWSDKKANGRFKNYEDVQKDVRKYLRSTHSGNLSEVQTLQQNMKQRRNRRNEFFHSTSLLDLNVAPRDCVEAFCDLLKYGELLLGTNWQREMEGARNLNTLAILLKLERKGIGDPEITSKVEALFRTMERNHKSVTRKGSHVTFHGEDFYTRLCIVHGGPEFRKQLSALLP